MEWLTEVSNLYNEIQRKCEAHNMTIEFAGYIRIRPNEGGEVNGLTMAHGYKKRISDELEKIHEDVKNNESDFIGW